MSDQPDVAKSYASYETLIRSYVKAPYFVERPPLNDSSELQTRLKRGDVNVTVEIPPGFGRDIKRGRPTEVGVWIDGAMPFRAETIRGYLQGVHNQFLVDPAIRGNSALAPAKPIANIEVRYRYNQDFDSIFAMVPSTIALQLALIPAILMALAIVREKELGSITNLSPSRVGFRARQDLEPNLPLWPPPAHRRETVILSLARRERAVHSRMTPA